MKKMMIASTVGMGIGAGLAAFVLTNKQTKNKANQLLNTAMEEANQMLKCKM